jgi:hypothetical protein
VRDIELERRLCGKIVEGERVDVRNEWNNGENVMNWD